mgnify:CR=1 FL=1
MPESNCDYETKLDAGGRPYAISVPVRVRYVECDPMRVAHHSSYVAWLEMARTELLRARGYAYRDLEERGVFMVIARMSLKYRRPARYDDVIDVYCQARPTAGVKLIHDYKLTRNGELILEAETTLVVVDENGKMKPVPEELITAE